MRLFVHFDKPLDAVVHIHLGSGEAGVPEQFFYGIQVGAMVGKMGRKGVAQHVRTALLGRGYGRKVFPNDVINVFRADLRSFFVEKEPGLVVTGKSLAADGEKGFEKRAQVSCEWHEAILVAFARDAQHGALNVEVADLQAGCLAAAYAGCIQYFQQQPMKLAGIIVAECNMGKQGGHLAFLYKNGKPFPGFGRHHLLHGVLFYEPPFSEKTEIRFQTGEAAVDTPGTLAVLHLGNHPAAYMQMPYFGYRSKALMLSTMSNKILQITAISRQCVWRKTALERQISVERLFVKHDN